VKEAALGRRPSCLEFRRAGGAQAVAGKPSSPR
jgi:hypothetical protein